MHTFMFDNVHILYLTKYYNFFEGYKIHFKMVAWKIIPFFHLIDFLYSLGFEFVAPSVSKIHFKMAAWKIIPFFHLIDFLYSLGFEFVAPSVNPLLDKRLTIEKYSLVYNEKSKCSQGRNFGSPLSLDFGFLVFSFILLCK